MTKRWAKERSLHTLQVFGVLKSDFEKIKTVKKWTGMQNKQCNGVCHLVLATFQRYCKKPNNQGYSHGDNVL